MEEHDIQQNPANLHLLTPEGYQELQAELEHLMGEKRAEIAERLRESKEHGEFSEDNSELDEVKNEQAMIESRISELRELFATAQILEPDAIPTKHAGLGSYVTLNDEERKLQFEVRLVASIESDPDKDLLSVESPLGQALYGREVGETVTFNAPAGTLKYKVEKIRK